MFFFFFFFLVSFFSFFSFFYQLFRSLRAIFSISWELVDAILFSNDHFHHRLCHSINRRVTSTLLFYYIFHFGTATIHLIFLFLFFSFSSGFLGIVKIFAKLSSLRTLISLCWPCVLVFSANPRLYNPLISTRLRLKKIFLIEKIWIVLFLACSGLLAHWHNC